MNRKTVKLPKRPTVFAAATLAAFAACATPLTQKIAETQQIVRTDKWHGFERTVFKFEGRNAWVVEPPCALAQGAPWTWTMQWADAFVERTQVPALLARGWRHATIDLFPTRMDEKGLETAAAFQKFLVEKLGFAPQVNLVGMSWGGFFSIRYAAAHPGNVRRIYLDAPLLSFDGFKAAAPAQAAKGAIGPWKNAMPAQGAKWSDDPRMPINMAKQVADAGIPVLLLFGGKDDVVPPSENALPFISKFIAAGGEITVVQRPEYGHHPHGTDPDKAATILDFFLASGRRASAPATQQQDKLFDIVIYGSTPAGLAAAVQAKRMGASVVVVSPETRIGGLTTGGLGATDIGSKAAFGGIALEFYRDVARWYGNPDRLKRQFPDEARRKAVAASILKAGSKWTFEPSAALAILEGWEKRDSLDIRRGEKLDRVDGVEKDGGRIVSIKTLSGRTFRAKTFIDATYEGDLMAAAGVSYHVGREPNGLYGETLNGNQPGQAVYHQFNKGVSPYIKEGDPSSGLLPGVEPFDPDAGTGDGDSRVQAYCFRMCLTDDPENRIPFAKPAGYDEKNYELLFRNLAAGPLDRDGVPWGNSKMPNRKTDTNNRTAFSLDFIGGSARWPEATFEEREKILAAHLEYQKGLVWTLANHPRVPEHIRAEVSRWGTCKDEFPDGPGDGWPRQLYVREARRMAGEYVMTEHNCRGTAFAPRPVAMGAYTMDSHHVRRIVGEDGFVCNEGDVEVSTGVDGKRFPPYSIDYGAIVPKRAECSNLLVPVCLSASHIAFGSIRMEPVFFALGQAAGTAAALAAAGATAVQDVPYPRLREKLLAGGQVLQLP